MARQLGINLSINLSKIDKSKITTSKKGEKFINLNGFLSLDELSKYDNHGSIQNTKEKDAQTMYCGNIDIFWSNELDFKSRPKQNTSSLQVESFEDLSDDIPF